MNYLKIAIPLMILISLGPHYLFGTDRSKSSFFEVNEEMNVKEEGEGFDLSNKKCNEDLFEVTWQNSARAERNGQLYGYINIPKALLTSACGISDKIAKTIISITQNVVIEWWAKDRFSSLRQAEIHIISAKEENDMAALDFETATKYGVLKFQRDDSGVVALTSGNLDFSNVSK